MKRRINQITIHVTETPNGYPISIEDINAAFKSIGHKRDSQNSRNFNADLKHIGYHRVIEVDGTIKKGVHLEEEGSPFTNKTDHSIDVVLVGTDKFTKQQLNSLHGCIISLADLISGRSIIASELAMHALKNMDIHVKSANSAFFNADAWYKNAMKIPDEHLLEL